MSIFKILTRCILITYCLSMSQECIKSLTPQQRSLVQSSNVFGFKLFDKILLKGKSNVFLSPLSVSLALGMTYNGARSNTLWEMKQTLEYDEQLSQEEMNLAYRPIIDLLNDKDPNVVMNIANSVWYRDSLHVLDNYIASVGSVFDAFLKAIDFSDPLAASTVNQWVKEKTRSKIDKIVEDPIRADTVLILLNAIYFKGNWAEPFDPEDTTDQIFKESDLKERRVKMMSIEKKFDYFETPEFQAVDLPYGDGDIRMTIFLPKESININEFLTNWNEDNWQKWTSKMSKKMVYLQLPRFEIEFEQSLKEILIPLGMKDAFSPSEADFSGMSHKQIYVDDVKHKTYVKVNEEGTEAAAVTSVMMGRSLPPEPVEMIVNHPFVFVIHDSHLGVILFMGKVVSPSESDNSNSK